MNALSSSNAASDDIRYARVHRALAWVWLGVLVLLIAALLVKVLPWRGQIDTDLLALLPVDERNPRAEAALKTLAQHGEQQLVLLLTAPASATAQRAAHRVREMLRDAPLAPQPAPADVETLLGLYFPYRAGLVTDQDRRWATDADPPTQAQRAWALAYQPFTGSALNWRDDPFGFFGNWLLQLGAASPARPHGDMLMVQTEDRHHAVLLYQLTQSAFSSDLQTRLDADLSGVKNELARQFPDVQLLRAGVVLHATAAAQKARFEMSLIGGGALLSCLLLTWYVFRSVKALRLILLSLAVGALTALSLTWMMFDRLHVLTLVFGASLIGVAVDYGVLVLAQHLNGSDAPHRWHRFRRLLSPLTLVLIAPALAYFSLLLMPFPGVRQMACFAVSGIIGAWLTIMLWHPYLLPSSLPETKLAAWLMQVLQHWPRWTATRAQWIVAALTVVVIGAGIAQLKTNDDVRSLINADPELLREQIDVARALELPSPAQLFLITGATPEEVLQHEEALLAKLAPIIAAGKLIGFDAISRWLPSEQRQQAAQQAQQTLTDARAALAEELELADDWITVPLSAPLTADEWLAHPATKSLRYLWQGRIEHDDRYSSIVLLKGLRDADTARQLAALSDAHVQWVDKTAEVSSLMGRYRALLSFVLVAAYIMVPLALLIFFRAHTWRVVLPSLLATLGTLAIMGYIGLPLQLLNVLTLLLVFGMGIDYGLFLIAQKSDARAFLAICVAALLTLPAFGLLALSSTPALQTIGLTTVLGISLAWLFTPLFRLSVHDREHFFSLQPK
ncbi:MAG: MMPL family transporter [Proteobacteria bacterium]|nr:MMPL family transporter [Pseudomonadota bacterium]MCL2306850.1 MMPL family transporter [Pseudomonadota bacterium]